MTDFTPGKFFNNNDNNNERRDLITKLIFFGIVSFMVIYMCLYEAELIGHVHLAREFFGPMGK